MYPLFPSLAEANGAVRVAWMSWKDGRSRAQQDCLDFLSKHPKVFVRAISPIGILQIFQFLTFGPHQEVLYPNLVTGWEGPVIRTVQKVVGYYEDRETIISAFLN